MFFMGMSLLLLRPGLLMCVYMHVRVCMRVGMHMGSSMFTYVSMGVCLSMSVMQVGG